MLAGLAMNLMASVGSEEKKEAGGFYLTGKNVILIPYIMGMATAEHVSWLNDKTLMRFSEQRHHHHSVETQNNYLRAFPRDSFIWLIRIKGYDVGTITAMVDPYNGVADMGILIGNGHHGNGYGEEAWGLVMKFLIEGNIRKIECGCRADNEAMKYIANNAGMKEEGRRWSHFLDDRDHPIDLLGYGFHNGAWKAEILGGQHDAGDMGD